MTETLEELLRRVRVKLAEMESFRDTCTFVVTKNRTDGVIRSLNWVLNPKAELKAQEAPP